jgi:hypothetical protein
MMRWFTLCLIVTAFGLAGCTRGTTPSAGKGKEKDGKGTEEKKERSTLVIGHEALAKEFAANADEADGKLKWAKTVEVTGPVNNTLRGVVFFGAVKDKEGKPIWIKCTGQPEDEKSGKFLRLSKGQKVKIVGTYASYRNNEAWLENCVVTELDPSTQKAVPAPQLTKEFESDDKAAGAKYKDEDVLVSGTILEVAPEALKLMGTEKTQFEIEVGEVEMKTYGKDLKKGQAVEIRGSNARLVPILNRVVISNGYIMSPK